MTSGPPTAPDVPAPAKRNRAGRNLPAAIGSAVVLLAAVAAALATFDAFPFVLLAYAAVAVALWEFDRVLHNVGTVLPREPLYAGSAAMLLGAWWGGAPALAAALAVTALAVLLWRLRSGVTGYLRDATAGVFLAVYLPFLAGFVVLLVRADDGIWRVLTFVLVTIASDIGGYAAGVTLRKHPMAPRSSP